jgi:hypothetical protein
MSCLPLTECYNTDPQLEFPGTFFLRQKELSKWHCCYESGRLIILLSATVVTAVALVNIKNLVQSNITHVSFIG